MSMITKRLSNEFGHGISIKDQSYERICNSGTCHFPVHCDVRFSKLALKIVCLTN